MPFVDERLPLPPGPLQLAKWVVASVRQKEKKRYGDAARTLLVIELCDCPWFDASEATDAGRQLEASGCAFREVWVVSREKWVSSEGEVTRPR